MTPRVFFPLATMAFLLTLTNGCIQIERAKQCVTNEECPIGSYCCGGLCLSPEELAESSCADSIPDVDGDAGMDVSFDGSADIGEDISWPDVGPGRDVLPDTQPDVLGDTTHGTDVPGEVTDGDTNEPDTPTPDTGPDADTTECGNDICEPGEGGICEADCGSSETYGRYVGNFYPEDIPIATALNPSATPQIEVNLPSIGWVTVATAGEFFDAGSDLEGAQWRITLPSMPGQVGCAESMILPPCIGSENICSVTWPPMVTTDLNQFTLEESGETPFVVSPTYECVWDQDLPVDPEIFCPTTSTVIRVGDGLTNLFCVEPLHLSGSDELVSQCRDQRVPTDYGESCGLSARSFPTDFPTWAVEQTIEATGTTRFLWLTL